MHFTCSEEQLGELCLLEQKKLLLNISDIERETVEFLGNFLLQECWNWIVCVRENQFIGAYFCKLRFFFKFEKKSRKELLMLCKCFSGSLLESMIYVSRETFWEKTKFWKKYWTIFEVELPNWKFSWKPLRQAVKTAFYVFRKAFWGNVCFWREKSVSLF